MRFVDKCCSGVASDGWTLCGLTRSYAVTVSSGAVRQLRQS